MEDSGIDQDLRRLLAGEVLPAPEIDICFLKPEDRANSQEKMWEHVPMCKQSIGYIAMAMIFNEEGKMCLIQEAKRSCRGEWYIPAGRVEPGENFIDGVKREVLEEAGLEFSPLTLLSVESFGSVNWFRFVYVAKVTGGKLKTTAEADEESLQAQWFSVDEIKEGKMKLRHKDFFPAMKMAQKYLRQSESCRRPVYHIGIQAHQYMLHRPVLVRHNNGASQLLVYKKNGSHFPCCQFMLCESNLLRSLFYVFRDVFSLPPSVTSALKFDLRGLLTLEHCGVPVHKHDGTCFTSVIIVSENAQGMLDKVTNQNYEWQEVRDPDLLAEFKTRINSDGMLVPLVEG